MEFMLQSKLPLRPPWWPDFSVFYLLFFTFSQFSCITEAARDAHTFTLTTHLPQIGDGKIPRGSRLLEAVGLMVAGKRD